MYNIYYNPEKFGLTVIGEIDYGEMYEFDKIVVWERSDGVYVWGADSGCSCPTPFEDTTLDELEFVGPLKYFVVTLTKNPNAKERKSQILDLIEKMKKAGIK